MGLIISNLPDGSSVNVVTGKVAQIDLQAAPSGVNVVNRALLVQWDTAVPSVYLSTVVGGVTFAPFTIQVASAAQVMGDLNPQAFPLDIRGTDFYVNPGQSFTPAAWLTFAGNVPSGTYYISVAIQGPTGGENCIIQLRILPSFNLPIYPPLAWMPAGLIDIQHDMDKKTVNSAIMSRQNGLTQSSDFTLGIVPLQLGALVVTGITAISLDILPAPGSGYPVVTFTQASPALTEIGSDPTKQFYTLTGDLRGSEIKAWMLDANVLAKKASPPQPPPDTLQAWAQLKITDALGIHTSQSFQFPILQALNQS